MNVEYTSSFFEQLIQEGVDPVTPEETEFDVFFTVPLADFSIWAISESSGEIGSLKGILWQILQRIWERCDSPRAELKNRHVILAVVRICSVQPQH